MTHKSSKAKKDTSLVTWGPAASIILIAAIYLSTQIIAYILIYIYPSIKHWDATQASQWLNNSTAAQFWVTVIIESLSIFFLGLYLKKKLSNFKSIGLVGKPRFVDMAWAILGFFIYLVIYYVAIIFISKLIPQFNVSQKQDIGFNNATSGINLLMAFVSLVVLPPIVEEILFRGFLYTGLRTKLPKISAALVVSFIFCLPHLIESSSGILWIAGVDTFILSLTLVWLREKTGSLYASMGTHMLKNLIAFLFLFHIS